MLNPAEKILHQKRMKNYDNMIWLPKFWRESWEVLTYLRLRNANVPNERSFQGLSKTGNLSLLSIPETEKYALKHPDPVSESYKGKTLISGNFCKNHISSFLWACFSSLITARNGGHCTNLGTRVDPLTSILAVLARSCQILTTSWQPWIP